MPNEPAEVLDFWFGREDEPGYGKFRDEWFQKDEKFDRQVRERFLNDYENAARGAYDGWREEPEGCLALVILLDQFPRNLFRGDPRTYATDGKALEVSEYAIRHAIDRKSPGFKRTFLYMPFRHSERAEDQHRSVELFHRLADEDDGPTLRSSQRATGRSWSGSDVSRTGTKSWGVRRCRRKRSS